MDLAGSGRPWLKQDVGLGWRWEESLLLRALS